MQKSSITLTFPQTTQTPNANLHPQAHADSQGSDGSGSSGERELANELEEAGRGLAKELEGAAVAGGVFGVRPEPCSLYPEP